MSPKNEVVRRIGILSYSAKVGTGVPVDQSWKSVVIGTTVTL